MENVKVMVGGGCLVVFSANPCIGLVVIDVFVVIED